VTAPANSVEPTRGSLGAAGFAALAEAGILFLPAHLILADIGVLPSDPVPFALPFVVAFVGAVVLANSARHRVNVTAAASGAAVAIGLLLGRGDLEVALVSVVVALLVAIRVVTLSLRDWRAPIPAWVAAGVLLIEALLSAELFPRWRLPLIVFVPTFFLASLASRAEVVWAANRAEDLHGRWPRRALGSIVAFGGAMVATVALGVRSGVLEWAGRLLSPIANALIYLLAYVMVVLGRPVIWLIQWIGIDPEKLREFLASLRQHAAGTRRTHFRPSGSPVVARIVGLLVAAGIAWLLVSILRKFRLPEEPEAAWRRNPEPLESSPVAVEQAPRRRIWPRRELPSDTVRRWYAEILLVLERRELPKEPSLTPTEYLSLVIEAFPGCGGDFEPLTQAYDDVRYGHFTIPRDRLNDLADHHRALLRTLSAGSR
jgi:hypothetical protein